MCLKCKINLIKFEYERLNLHISKHKEVNYIKF